MKKWLKKVVYSKRAADYMLPFFLRLHQFCYHKIGTYAVLKHGLHPKHHLMNYHEFFVNNVDEEDVVLDLGCGNGANAYDVAAKAKKVVGIDISPKNIATAKDKYHRDNLEYICDDALRYRFGLRFHKIVFSNVLEHIEDRVGFLKQLHQLSGTILLRVPMLDRDWLTLYKKEQGYEYRLDDTHYIEYTMDDLRRELKESGWKIDRFSIQFGEFWGVLSTDPAHEEALAR